VTTVRRSIPTRATPLTAEQRIVRAQRQADRAVDAAEVVAADVVIVDAKAEAAQDDADQALLDAANAQTDADTAIIAAGDASTDAAGALLAVDDVVDGTTSFTALKVGGVNVKPFLDNTDGTKLTNAAGLASSVVSTAKIAAQGVTNAVSAFTNTSQTLTTTEQNCQGVTYTSTGERLEVFFSFYLNVYHPAGGGISTTLRLYRQGTLIWDFTVAATGDDFAFGWQSVVVPDQPAAGSYLYQLTTQLSAATAASATAGSRFMSVTELKR